MAIPRSHHRQLDDKMLFEKYMEMGAGGSALKLLRWLDSKGIKNSKGKTFTTSAVWQSIWRYVARNIEEAKEPMREYYLLFGIYLTDEHYDHIVSNNAKTCFAPRQYKNWLKQHPNLPDYTDGRVEWDIENNRPVGE